MGFRRSLRNVCSAAVISAILSMAACAPKHYVRMEEDVIILSCRLRGAKKVLFASSIDRFQLHPATRLDGDRWEVEVPKANTFTYFYIVDNTAVIPDCQLTVLDDFGARNCLFNIDL